MLLILFVILLAIFVSALYVVYILLKSNHKIISTTNLLDVKIFQLINAKQFLLIKQINKNYLNEVEYTVYKKFSFKTFLLYLCYCLNEQFKENLNNHLVDKKKI